MHVLDPSLGKFGIPWTTGENEDYKQNRRTRCRHIPIPKAFTYLVLEAGANWKLQEGSRSCTALASGSYRAQTTCLDDAHMKNERGIWAVPAAQRDSRSSSTPRTIMPELSNSGISTLSSPGRLEYALSTSAATEAVQTY